MYHWVCEHILILEDTYIHWVVYTPKEYLVWVHIFFLSNLYEHMNYFTYYLFFENYTIQCRRSQHARTLTHMNTRTQTLPLWTMSTSEGLSTSRSGDSWSHQCRLVVDGNVAYHLTHNAGKSWKIQENVRAQGFEPPVGSVPLDRPTIRLQAQSLLYILLVHTLLETILRKYIITCMY
jgi:hypothetical protein